MEVLDPCVILETLASYIVSKGPRWKHCESSILLEAPVQMLPIQCPSRFWTVHIFYCPASLRVGSNEYFCFPTTHGLQPSILEDSSFSCQIDSSSFSKLLLVHSLLVSNFSVVPLWIPLLMESSFVPQGLLFIDVFQSSTWIVSSLLPHVVCHYTEILQWPANLSNHPVGNSHNVVGTFLFLDWSFPFDHLFEDGMPLIVVSLSQCFVNSSMNFDANCSPLSLRIFLGILCSFQISSR